MKEGALPRFNYGVGNNLLLPPGWTLEESPDDFVMAISPEGQECYLAYPYAFPRRRAAVPMKAGDFYCEIEGGLNLEQLKEGGAL